MSPLRSPIERLDKSILVGCVLAAGMLGGLWLWVLVGGADPPAREPDNALRPHLTPDASQELQLGSSATLYPWHQAMRDAGICELVFLGDGSGVWLSVRKAGKDCEDGPVISFPEFRRRMEEPEGHR